MGLPWRRIALGSRQASMSLADPALEPQYGLKFSAAVNPEQAEKWFAGSGDSFAVAAFPAARFHPGESGGGARRGGIAERSRHSSRRGPCTERPVRGADGASGSLGDRRTDQRRPHLQRRHGQRFRRGHADRYRAIAERIQAEAAPLAAV